MRHWQGPTEATVLGCRSCIPLGAGSGLVPGWQPAGMWMGNDSHRCVY